MKKLLKMGICIMMAAVVLSGCGGGNSKTETAVYEGEINGVKVSNTIDYSGLVLVINLAVFKASKSAFS